MPIFGESSTTLEISKLREGTTKLISGGQMVKKLSTSSERTLKSYLKNGVRLSVVYLELKYQSACEIFSDKGEIS